MGFFRMRPRQSITGIPLPVSHGGSSAVQRKKYNTPLLRRAKDGPFHPSPHVSFVLCLTNLIVPRLTPEDSSSEWLAAPSPRRASIAVAPTLSLPFSRSSAHAYQSQPSSSFPAGRTHPRRSTE